jgi:hypothetical protein
MKRLFLFSLIVSFIVLSTTAFAAERVPLGAGNVALKLDYINFTDSVFERHNVDTGYYIGLEAYGEVSPNLYLGAEVGYANPDGNYELEGINVETEATFVPIEVNLKYAFKAAPNFVIDVGAGVSYSYAKFEETPAAVFTPFSEDDWLFGGQFFVDLNYTINQFFIGVNAKYQLTEDFQDFDFNYNNWRIGGQVGLMF